MFESYFGKLLKLDAKRRLHDVIWAKFSGPVRLLRDNKYTYHRFWHHQNQLPGFADGEMRFNDARQQTHQALMRQDTLQAPTTRFDRLYVLRNQLMHGGATWNSSVNRAQVRDGAAILTFLIPLFVDLMKDNPDMPWGKAHYPPIA